VVVVWCVGAWWCVGAGGGNKHNRLSDKEARFIKAGSTPLAALRTKVTEFQESSRLGSSLSKRSPPKFFTINDESDQSRKNKDRAAGVEFVYASFLPSRFPTPSQWELTGPQVCKPYTYQ